MTLFLTIATPTEMAVARTPVTVVRAEDDSGSFGIMAGHADLLTMMRQAILRWSDGDGQVGFCAVEGALLVVSDGTDVRVSARQALRGDRLETLEQAVAAMRSAEAEAGKRERVAATRLHARAVRNLVAHLRAPTPEAGEYA